jgi:hypothetical protein
VLSALQFIYQFKRAQIDPTLVLRPRCRVRPVPAPVLRAGLALVLDRPASAPGSA